MNENSSLTFSGVNAVSVADSAAGSNADSLTLTVGHGTLTLGSTTRLTFTSGANGTAAMTVSGTVSNLDAALTNLTYTPTPLYTGSDSLHISITDPGDNDTANKTVTLTVIGLTPPAITAPSSVSLNENSSLTFSGANAISVADSAAGSNPDSLTLSVSHGQLTLGSTTGLTFTTGANGTAAMTVSGR